MLIVRNSMPREMITTIRTRIRLLFYQVPSVNLGLTVKDSYFWASVCDFILGAGESVRSAPVVGTTQGDLYWCREGTATWNNGGDCVYLLTGREKPANTLLIGVNIVR
jgi:hypothetical protein